jgi:tripartite-type tricarboxylate transporter receptor subunit TctC
VQSVKQLIDYGKANPGKLTYGSGNSTGIVAGATFTRMAGFEALHVPYKSTPPALTDLVGGQISMMFVDFGAGIGQVRAGKIRPLAVTTAQRSALLPDLPSMAEAGLPGFDITSWNGVFAPAQTPPEIVKRLNAELVRIVATPEAQEQFAKIGFDAFTSTPQELAAFVEAELVNWAKLIKDAGIEPE